MKHKQKSPNNKKGKIIECKITNTRKPTPGTRKKSTTQKRTKDKTKIIMKQKS